MTSFTVIALQSSKSSTELFCWVNIFSVMSVSWVLPVLSGSKVSCSRTQHGGGRFQTPDLSLQSLTPLQSLSCLFQNGKLNKSSLSFILLFTFPELWLADKHVVPIKPAVEEEIIAKPAIVLGTTLLPLQVGYIHSLVTWLEGRHMMHLTLISQGDFPIPTNWTSQFYQKGYK